MEKYNSGISFSTGALLIKWNILNQVLVDLKLESGSEVDLFINFESILKNICKNKKFNIQMNFYLQKIVIELESSILNLIAHYRAYFKKNKIRCNIYFYYTDLSKSNNQLMKTESKYYRNYYFNKYINNPEFKNISRLMNIVVPDLEVILKFIEGVYLIKTSKIDGSLVPKLLSVNKSIIITEDLFDTIYNFEDFKVLYIRSKDGSLKNRLVLVEPIEIVNSFLEESNIFNLGIFSNELYFKLLLTFKGSIIRNITPLSSENLSLLDFSKLLRSRVSEGLILENFKSIESVLDFVPKGIKDELKKSFKLFDLNLHLSKVTESISQELKDQVVDEFDNESLMSLNNQRFLEFPVNLVDLVY